MPLIQTHNATDSSAQHPPGRMPGSAARETRADTIDIDPRARSGAKWVLILRPLLRGIAVALFPCCCLGLSAENEAKMHGQGVQITQLSDRLRIEINRQLFTEYLFKDVPRPY